MAFGPDYVDAGQQVTLLQRIIEADQVATIAPVIRAIDSETKTCAADSSGAGCALVEPLPKTQTFSSGEPPRPCPKGQVMRDGKCAPLSDCLPNQKRNEKGECVQGDICTDRGCCCDVDPGNEKRIPLAFGALTLCFGAGAVVRRRRRGR